VRDRIRRHPLVAAEGSWLVLSATVIAIAVVLLVVFVGGSSGAGGGGGGWG
jgi:hypothetical protein